MSSVVGGVENFLTECGLSAGLVSNNQSLRDYFVTRLEAVMTNLEEVMACVGTEVRLDLLLNRTREYLHRFQAYSNVSTQPVEGISAPSASRQGNLRGRPFLHVNIDMVELLRGVGYTWQEVANAIGVSRTTLWRRLVEENVTLSPYADISDHDLDEIIVRIHRSFPNSGLVMIQGHLLSEGVHVQRQRVREAVARCDPIRRKVRWHQVLSRRTYFVPRPNSLWHIDGHHSLIRWRFVIHGAIDGYSRLIVYLQCNTNNKAQTVFNLFWRATRQYGIPSRVRSDKGGENVMICHFMVSQRGIGRGSHIAGSSAHNQRIERLWRDVYRCVASTYHGLFYYMEEMHMMDPENELDLFVLHCVFLPVINQSLEFFTQAWNEHPLRTERMWSPKKIWINGVMRSRIEGHLPDIVDPVPDDLDGFGIDSIGQTRVRQQVTIPDTICPLNESRKQRFLDCIHLMHTELDHTVSKFVQAKDLLIHLLSLEDSSSDSSE